MTENNAKFSRRQFLQAGLMGAAALLMPGNLLQPAQISEWPENVQLGRICSGKIDVKLNPSPDAKTVKSLYEDAVVIWQKDVIGEPNIYRGANRRWIETPDGYLYSPEVQPVRSVPNKPVDTLPGNGMWVEVTVPFVFVTLSNPPIRSPVMKELPLPWRFYYSQVFWVDEIKQMNGKPYYRISEKHGSYGDIFWADATAFRPISEGDLAPITPEVSDKKVVINVGNQSLACFEGKREVYYCRISSGAKFNSDGKAVDKWATPVGLYHVISRKYVTIHMAGGTRASGYELFSVPWTSIFASGGVAIHATYWHNNYGEPMSHGCVNVKPEDAKWIYRWSNPQVPYDTGIIEVTGYSGTKVEVIDTSA